jgi:hypothetical protein
VIVAFSQVYQAGFGAKGTFNPRNLGNISFEMRGSTAQYNNNHLWNHRAIDVSADGSSAVVQSDFSSALMDTSTKTNPILVKYTATIGAPVSGAVSGTTVYIGQSSGSELYWVWDTVANTVTKANNSFGQSVVFNSVMYVSNYLFAASSGTAKGVWYQNSIAPIHAASRW